MLDSELTNNGTNDNDGAGHGGIGSASSDAGVDRPLTSGGTFPVNFRSYLINKYGERDPGTTGWGPPDVGPVW